MRLRLAMASLLAFALLLGPLAQASSADPGTGGVFTDQIQAPGVIQHRLPDGGLLTITASRTTRVPPGLVRTDPSNVVTVGIQMYNVFGVLLWTFSETVNWSWDGSQVLTDFPSSSANTFTAGWYVASQPAPSTFWDLFPIREGNYAQATFQCCGGPINLQTQNPQITIIVDALGGWSARTQCC